jgi:PBP1b-binding outer membrane lipoprotein LpoB
MARLVGLGLAGAFVLAGCASAPKAAERVLPDWFKEQVAAADSSAYPDLASIPEPRAASAQSAERATQIEDELLSEKRALETSPRAAPAEPVNAGAFESQARDEINRGRPK